VYDTEAEGHWLSLACLRTEMDPPPINLPSTSAAALSHSLYLATLRRWQIEGEIELEQQRGHQQRYCNLSVRTRPVLQATHLNLDFRQDEQPTKHWAPQRFIYGARVEHPLAVRALSRRVRQYRRRGWLRYSHRAGHPGRRGEFVRGDCVLEVEGPGETTVGRVERVERCRSLLCAPRASPNSYAPTRARRVAHVCCHTLGGCLCLRYPLYASASELHYTGACFVPVPAVQTALGGQCHPTRGLSRGLH
jgi:hypothetical protein